MQNIELNEQQVDWLKEQLHFMLEKEGSSSQFSENVMRSLLRKLNEETYETPTQETSSF